MKEKRGLLGGSMRFVAVLIVLMFIMPGLGGADDFEGTADEEFKAFAAEQSEFLAYQEQVYDEFTAYQRIVSEEFQKYRRDILRHWENCEVTGRTNWVEYSPDYRTKRVVDFEKGYIEICVISKEGDPGVEERLARNLEEVVGRTRKDAFAADAFSRGVEERLVAGSMDVKTAESIDEAPVVGDILTGSRKPDEAQVKAAAAELIKEGKVAEAPSKEPGSQVVTLKISLPSDRLQKKADQYKESVVKNAGEYHVDPALVFAVIQTESSFNPMARSHVPAYGLMQIVPKSAGLDASKKVFGKKVLLSPSYLYDGENNIGIGAAYLHILSKRYMRAVKNDESRLYCVIAAYNTGSGNVARAFTGRVGMSNAAKVINSMAPEAVYRTLIDNLPHEETVNYLKKVSDRMKHYSLDHEKVL